MKCFKDSYLLFHVIVILALGFTSTCSEAMQYHEPLNIEDLKSLFGEDDCIEGSLSVTEIGSIVMQSISTVELDDGSTLKIDDKIDTGSNIQSDISLLYELAEFNKIKVQFILTDEKGPAHKKTFVVSLKLGEEEYVGEGPSIKKAQHEASKYALNSTLYGHPQKKIKTVQGFQNNKTPVKKIEAWARKHNSATVKYSFSERTQLRTSAHKNLYHKGIYSTAENVHRVTLKIGNKVYNGEGSTSEIAKNNAASNALKSLQTVDGFCMLTDKEKNFFTKLFESDFEYNSPISLVHEFGAISNVPVVFDLYSEEGPAHIKKIVYKCNVGEDFETFGEGSSKKSAKSNAAENMVQRLKQYASFSGVNCDEIHSKKSKPKKKKSKNFIKSVVKSHPLEEENFAEYSVPEDLDPVSKLFQIQQAKHEVLPVFTLLEKKNNEFFIEAKVNELSAVGSGSNKKSAKKKAAQVMLEMMGYSTNNNKLKFPEHKKKEFTEDHGASKQKKLGPGLNLNADQFQQTDPKKESRSSQGKSEFYKDNDNVPQSEDHLENEHQKPKIPKNSNLRPKKQLIDLAQLLGFTFKFSDFPKGNNNGFVSLVSLTTVPPKVCFGVGITIELSQDEAALSALGGLYKSQLNYISQILREEGNEVEYKHQRQIEMTDETIIKTDATKETD